MKKFIWFLGLIFIVGCADDINKAQMGFTETGCSNPWDGENYNDHYIDKIRRYLQENNVHPYKISFEIYYTVPVCLACTCPTGRMIIISIDDDEIDKAEAVGFFRLD